MTLPKIAVLSLGGTISSAQKSEEGVVASLDAKQLISSIPQVTQFAKIEALPFRMVASPGLTFDDLLALRDKIEELFSDGVDGAVVTQGTDTIEETSFFLNTTVRSEKPVVVTGAMRNPTLAGPDGPANLLAAIQVAASGKTGGMGTVVVMNDEIHHSKYVTKRHTFSPSAFYSFPLGAIGWISEGNVRIALKPAAERVIVNVDSKTPRKEVVFYTILTGDTGLLLHQIGDIQYDGMILEAAGGGHVVPNMADYIGSLAKDKPIVLTSRTRNGEVLTRTYSFPGSESDMLKRGLIPGRALNSLKARILLYLLLRSGASSDEIRKVFENWF